MRADYPNEEPPPDGVIVWELDPEKPLTAYWVRYGGTDIGRFLGKRKFIDIAYDDPRNPGTLLEGRITAAVYESPIVPEPASLILLGTGLVDCRSRALCGEAAISRATRSYVSLHRELDLPG